MNVNYGFSKEQTCFYTPSPFSRLQRSCTNRDMNGKHMRNLTFIGLEYEGIYDFTEQFNLKW